MDKYSNVHVIHLSFNNGAEGFQIPINPEAIEVRQSGNGKTYDIVGKGNNAIPGENDAVGEINVIKSPGLMEISFKSYFPANDSPLVPKGVELEEPMVYTNMIRSWMHAKHPIRFIYVGRYDMVTRDADGKAVQDINIPASIERFEWKEVGGAPGDIEYSITLKEYRFYAAKKYDVVKENGKTILYQRMRDRLDERVRPETYILQEGDTLGIVARKILGDDSRRKEIQKLNGLTGADLKNLKAGQVIKIPQN